MGKLSVSQSDKHLSCPSVASCLILIDVLISHPSFFPLHSETWDRVFLLKMWRVKSFWSLHERLSLPWIQMNDEMVKAVLSAQWDISSYTAFIWTSYRMFFFLNTLRILTHIWSACMFVMDLHPPFAGSIKHSPFDTSHQFFSFKKSLN